MLSVMRNGVLVPAATVPGPPGTIGTQGPQGIQGDLFYSTIYNGITGSQSITGAMLSTTRLWNLSGNATLTTLGNPTTLTLSGTMTLCIKQPATGGPFTITWPALTTLRWPNDTVGPAMPTLANSELIVNLFWSGYAWRGVPMGVFYP